MCRELYCLGVVNGNGCRNGSSFGCPLPMLFLMGVSGSSFSIQGSNGGMPQLKNMMRVTWIEELEAR